MRRITPTSTTLVCCAALLLAGCGANDGTETKAAEVEESTETVATVTAGLPATRDAVVEALTCHALVSQAMAAGVLSGDGAAVRGVREQGRWRDEADRRARAAGLADEDFAALKTQARAPVTSAAEWEAKRPMVDDCLDRTPPG